MESKKIKVSSCLDCPFRSISFGGSKGLVRRLQLACNLQPEIGTQWRSEGEYKCFKTCPLKSSDITVKLK